MAVRIESGSEPIPGYKLIERLGGGGFGEVWKCEAPGGIHKAIKVVYGDLTSAEEDGIRRAEQELKALKRVQSVRHPFLLSLERYDIVENRLLIVMELADRNLWDRFRECRSQNLPGIPREELLRYMEESAEVLDLMNTQHQLQHLDIKPQNLFLIHNHCKVADFGLVKDLEGMMATVTGGITPVYASPETFDGVVSRFCDQYSLAIVYQELLTGQRPFTGISLQQLIMQHLSAAPNLTPLPKADRAAIGRSLSKKPESRYPYCMDLIQALRKGTEEANKASVAGPAPAAAPRVPEESGPVGSQTLGARTPTGGSAPAPAKAEATPSRLETPPPRPETPPVSLQPVEETGPPIELEEPLRQPPPEITGDGVLFPALVIGLGQKGQEVLQTLREALHERFGSLEVLPHLRLLYVDTTAEAIHAATHDSGPGGLTPKDSVLLRLNRPSHYQKPGSGRMALESWCNPKLLYRIPRNPETTGMRCLGRLAFVDNFRIISSRMRSDLEACTEPNALAKADRQTRLGVRTNRPRVYIVTSLTGGSGSGMFLDTAFVARSWLRQLGYSEPDVVGLLLLPAAETTGGPPLPMGNAYAALTELNHYSSPDVVFSFRYDEKEPKIKDRGAPFTRTILVPMERETRKEQAGEATRLAGDFLFRDLVTPLGRTADESRRSSPESESSSEVTYQAMGLYRFSWPRRSMLQQAGRTLCLQLAENWSGTEGESMKEPVKTWLAGELSRLELDAEHLISFLQESCEKELGQNPQELLAGMVEPFVPKGKRSPDPDPEAMLEALQAMEELVGGPGETGGRRQPIMLAETMERAGDVLVQDWGEKLTQVANSLVDEPDYRLRGAEEALKQLTNIIDRTLEHYEKYNGELIQRAADAHQKIHSLLETLRANPGGGRRNAQVLTDLLEVMKRYPRWRYHILVLDRLAAIYTALRGQLTDQARQFTFCRHRLTELVHVFEAPSSGSSSGETGPGKYLLPTDCRSLDDAVRQLLETLTSRDLLDLDAQVEEAIRQNHVSLMEVCLNSPNVVKSLKSLMQQQAETYLGSRLIGNNVVEMFVQQYPDDEGAHAISEAFDEAAPPLVDDTAEEKDEVRLLALPPGPHAKQFLALVYQALKETDMQVVDSTDDIVFYREQPRILLAKLPLLGRVGQDAYRQLAAMEHFSPHSRTDITDWQEVAAE